jgi:hypothetical protein
VVHTISTSESDGLKIEAEIQWLEAVRRSCGDTGVQKKIDIWIEQRQKLRNVPRTTPPESLTRVA